MCRTARASLCGYFHAANCLKRRKLLHRNPPGNAVGRKLPSLTSCGCAHREAPIRALEGMGRTQPPGPRGCRLRVSDPRHRETWHASGALEIKAIARRHGICTASFSDELSSSHDLLHKGDNAPIIILWYSGFEMQAHFDWKKKTEPMENMSTHWETHPEGCLQGYEERRRERDSHATKRDSGLSTFARPW